MLTKPFFIAVLAATLAGAPVAAGTELDEAIAAGGVRLNADEIADLMVGQRITARAGTKMFNFYYDPANILKGELQGGGWSGSGHYAITDGNLICVSMTKDKGRYRCLTVVRYGDVVQKFNSDGKMAFELLSFEAASDI